MFEQPLYQHQPVATPLKEGDLFHDYEIRNWELTPRIYKILAVSAFFNLLAVLVAAQTSILTMKGCDSPLVGSVCQVLDTVYVGSLLFGNQREYVDAVYEKTDLADSDITYIDASKASPPLTYPAGYFEIANPGETAMLESVDGNEFTNNIPGIPSGIPIARPFTGGGLFETPPVVPKTNPHVIDGTLPRVGNSTPTYNPPITRRKNGRGGRVIASSPTPNPDGSVPGFPNEDTTAENKKPTPTPAPQSSPMSSEAVTAVEINKKPLTDFADGVATKWDAKDIDLNRDFMVVMDGVLTKDGKLDRKKSKFDVSKQKGDPKMIDVGKAALEAVADSGYLTYLKSLDVEKITVTLLQDDDHITVLIVSGQKTPERASTIASGINGYIFAGKLATKNPSDERTLLDAAKVTSDGRNFVLNFAIPKPVAQEMITRKLKEAQAKKMQQTQPNGNATGKPADKVSKK